MAHGTELSTSEYHTSRTPVEFRTCTDSDRQGASTKKLWGCRLRFGSPVYSWTCHRAGIQLQLAAVRARRARRIANLAPGRCTGWNASQACRCSAYTWTPAHDVENMTRMGVRTIMRSSRPGCGRCCCSEVLCWSRACGTAWPMVMRTMKERGGAGYPAV